MTEYQALEGFLGYLHQDWGLDYDTVWDVLDAYLADLVIGDMIQLAPQLAADVRQLLANSPSEDELADVTYRLGAYYVANWNGGTYREWLTEVSRRTEEWLQENGPKS